MEIIMLSASIAALVSLVTTKILATRYFEIANGYVEGICRQTKEFVQVMERKLQESLNP